MAIEIPGLRIDQSAADTGVSQLTNTVSAASEIGAQIDVMADVRIRKETRDADAYVSQKSTELILESQTLFDKVVNETEDPNKITENFMTEYNTLYGGKVADAPNAIARRNLEEKSNQLRASLGKAAIGVQADEVQAKRINGLQNSVDAAVINTRNTGNLTLGNLAIEEALSGAESYTRPSELLALREQANNQLKEAYLDRQFESGNLGEVRSKINDPEFNKDLKPAQVDGYRKAIKAEQRRLEALSYSDPIAAGVSPEMQMKRGAPLSQVRVLSNKQATQAVQQISQFTKPEEMTQFSEQLKATYGAFTPNAIAQMTKAGLPSMYSIAVQTASTEDTDFSQEQALMFDVIQQGSKEVKEAFKINLSANNEAAKDFNAKFDESLKESLDVWRSEGKSASNIISLTENTRSMAQAHYNKFGNIDDAVNVATEFPLKDRAVIEADGVVMAIDKNLNWEGVEVGIKEVKRDLATRVPVDDLIAASVIKKSVENESKFYPNETGDGVILLTTDKKIPLFDVRGELIEYKFDTLQNAAKTLIGKESLAQSPTLVKDIDSAFRRENEGELQLILESLRNEGGGKREGTIRSVESKLKKLRGE